MNKILLVQAMAPGLDQPERNAIWNCIGAPTVYHSLHENHPPIRLEGFTHVIFGGSESNISEGEEPWFEEARRIIWECDRSDIPFLGICFGMQFLAHTYGATVQRQHGEVGAVKIRTHADHPFFRFLPETFEANAAHFESVSNLPKHFLNLAHSKDCSIQIIGHKSKPLFGVQFHPEMDWDYINAIQNVTNGKYPTLSRAIVEPARNIITQFCQLSAIIILDLLCSIQT